MPSSPPMVSRIQCNEKPEGFLSRFTAFIELIPSSLFKKMSLTLFSPHVNCNFKSLV